MPTKSILLISSAIAKLEKRIHVLKNLIKSGWQIGVRLDPFVIYEGWEKDYINLFDFLFKIIPCNQLHSVTYGNIRFPKDIFMNIKKNYPDEKLFFKHIKKIIMFMMKITEN